MKFLINTVEKRSTNPSLKNLLREGCRKQNEKAKYCPLKYAYETLGRNYPITTFFENIRFSSFFFAIGTMTFINLSAVSLKVN